MKKYITTVLLSVFFMTLITNLTDNQNKNNQPVPTEYRLHKEKRKEFKKHRKAYIENMHKSHPDTDWRRIDDQTREQKVIQKTQFRSDLNEMGLDGNNELPAVRFSSRDIEGNWAERGSNNLSGRILTAEIDYENDLIYCASSGGNLWRGNLNGENWQSLNDYFQITGIRTLRFVDTRTENRLLIGTSGKKFYYTDNEGFTIIQSEGLTNLQNWGNIKRSVIKNDENSTIYILAKEWDYTNWYEMTTLHKSTDFGESFQLIEVLSESMAGEFDIWTPRYAPGEVYIQNENDVYYLDENDNLIPSGSLNSDESGGCLLVGGMNGNVPFMYARIGSEIYYSSNAGHSWQWRSSAPSGIFTNNSFNCSNTNPDYLYMGSIDLYRSSDGAASWQMVNNWWEYYGQEETKLHADIPEVRFFIRPDGNETAYISTDGGIYQSTDYIYSVQNLSLNGLGVSQYYSTYTSRYAPHNVYAGAQDQGYQRSVNDQGGILDFEQVISGDYGHMVSGNDGESIWCDYPGFVLYYPNASYGSNGLTWDFVGSNYLWIPPLKENPVQDNIIYVGGGGTGGNHIIELTANNYSISYQQLDFSFAATVSAIDISPIDPDYRYVLTTNGQFYTSGDGGDTWILSVGFSGPESHYFYGSAIHASAVDFGTVYIGGSGYSNPAVYVSEDHGLSFTSITNDLPSTLVFELAATETEDIIFAATEVGPYAYVPEENTWYDIAGVMAPDQTYWSVDFIPELGTARFGTYGRGIWDFTLEGFFWLTPGDINQDDIINIQDIILVINFILEVSYPDEEDLFTSDLNADGEINVQDIILLVSDILNIG